MLSKWTSHLQTDKEKEDFAKEVRSSRSVLERLSQIISEQEKDLDRVELNPKFYELPNWDYRQASNNGYRRHAALIQKLINLDQKETND